LEIHKSVQYADFALKKFFEAAQKESWYKNTIFVITADHTSQTKEKKYQTRSGAYQIPLLFFQPGDSTMQKQIGTYCSHVDIFPSIMHYINYPEKFISFGQSIFDSSTQNAVVTYVNTKYQYLAHNQALYFDGKDFIAAYNLKTDILNKKNIIDQTNVISEIDKNKFKAILQVFNERMTHNRLVISKSEVRQN
ncbi:MAG: sulfatase-like hydrolase/transferase, partial [Bacteroidota bacterium]|nr:sulfatase-like hydrolase/transferase [Bacteroidota bacterium]